MLFFSHASEKDADKMANSVDPDQTAHSGVILSLPTLCDQPDLCEQNFRIIQW